MVLRRLLLVLLAVAASSGGMATWAPDAAAHAILQSTSPGRDATLDEAPTRVTLTYNENVRATVGGVRVFGPDGTRVDSGRAEARGRVVSVAVDGDEEGTWAVSYRIVSADGHGLRGAWTFDVGAASTDDLARTRALAASKTSRWLEIGLMASRGVAMLALLIAAGGAIFVTVVGGGLPPVWYRRSLVVAIVAASIGYLLDAAAAGGFGIFEVLRPELLRDELRSAYGRSAALQVVLAVAALLLARVREPGTHRGWIAALPASLALAANSLGGHAIAADPVVVRLPLDILHSLAAAVWVGGIVQLASSSRAMQISGEALVRWSRLAFAAVVVLVLTGVFAAWVEIGLSLEAWTSTTYGRLVMAKVVLLLMTMPLAWRNRSRLVPAIAHVGESDRDVDEDAARRSLRSYVRAEAVLLVLVVACTAWLVQAVPARDAVVPPIVDRVVRFGDDTDVQLVVDPAQAGRNEIHLYALDDAGSPDPTVTRMALEATNTSRDIGPLDLGLRQAGPGHWTAGAAVIPYPGRWRMRIVRERGEFDNRQRTTAITIAPRVAG